MRPGISIQHSSLPARAHGLVRCDIAGIIGFIPRERWPEDASAGDFLEVVLRRVQDLDDHPQRTLFDAPSRRAVRSFFENGGDEAHLFGVCIESEADLKSPSAEEGALVPLLRRLQAEDDVALLLCPAAAGMRCEILRNGTVTCDADALYDLLLRHCRQMNNRFLVIDAPRGLHGDPLLRWFKGLRAREPGTRSYGAVYYPWLKRGDEIFPPSGAVTGLFARTELAHRPFGVGWPPANAPLFGTTHTEVEMDWAEAGVVGEAGLNPILVQPGRGVVVWGARTMSADPTFTFINSRRVVNLIAEQLRRDNEWTVFEVNDPSLWKIIERDVLVRLDQFWEGGLLSGARSHAEYSVECNEATNSAVARDSGQLHVAVSLRPVGTTERILIDLRLGANEP